MLCGSQHLIGTCKRDRQTRSMTSIDINALRAWVGREQRVSDLLSPFPARALAATLDHQRLPEVGDPLPVCWHWMYFMETPSSAGTGSDGHPRKGDFLPPVPLPRRMWASGALNIVHPLIIGSPAERISTVRSVDLKQGKSGALVFVTLCHRLQQRGRLCISEEQNLVYRALPTATAATAATAAGEPAVVTADWSRTIQPDPVLLFRFSALTYNAHRIHYDQDYAIRQEFYPGLVVHGPLLAILLLDLFVQALPDASPTHFSFRAQRPTFALGAVCLRGKRNGSNVKLWSADHENYVGLSATAIIGSYDR